MNKVLPKIFLFFFIIFLFLTFPQNFAFAQWQKSNLSPIINIGISGSWDDVHVSAPCVTSENGIYIMWYAGYNGSNWNIGKATSDDGENWEKFLNNPIFTPDASNFQENHVHTPMVIKENSLYKMWYSSSPNDISNFTIKLATSPDGINWTRHGVVLSPDQTWEINGVVDPSVLKIDSTYHMWYNGWSNTGVWRTGYATSSDGINWTKYATNPVSQNGTGSVIFNNNSFVHYYHIDNPPSILKATSSDGINWTNDPNNPLLTRGSSGSFDEFRMAHPSNTLRIGNTLKMWYSGNDGSNWRIGLAEKEIPTPEVQYLSQRDPAWANDDYDHLIGAKMDDRGCAVTSATMALKYQGVKHTPGNSDTGLPMKELNPGTLNEWLTSRNDGSFRNGEMNWDLVGIMTNLNYENDPNSTKVIYGLYYNPSPSILDGVLNTHNHGILELSNVIESPSREHFVVATGKQEKNYGIHDPFFTNRTNLYPSYITNPIARVGYYKITNSDFSVLLLAINPTLDIQFTDENGNNVGDIFIQNPIADLVNHTNNETALKMFRFQNPPSGTYTFTVSGNQNQTYQLDTYIYDIDGNGGVQTTTGTVGPNNTETFSIVFDTTSATNSTIDKNITFDVLRADIQAAYELKWITQRVRRSLLRFVRNAERAHQLGRIETAKNVLIVMKNALASLNGHTLNQEAYDLLSDDLNYLLNNL